MADAPVLFQGLSYPFRVGTTSFPALATDDDVIRDSLIQLIQTPKGSRVMRPDFGTNVIAMIFEANNEILAEMISYDVQSAIAAWEPRVSVLSVDVEQEDSTITLTITYMVIASKNVASVAIPFSTPGP